MDKDQKHIPFAVIVAATNGDETAIQEILDFYDGYISKLSLRQLYDEYGNVYMDRRSSDTISDDVWSSRRSSK